MHAKIYPGNFFFLLLLGLVSLHAQCVLTADGPGKTYERIASKLAPGYWPLETPDCSHPSFGRHIEEIYDSELGKFVFRFHIHRTPDNDRCKRFDRQRNEIKVYRFSPDSLKGFWGDSLEYRWKFKLDSLFQPSFGFTHLHQIKAVGGKEDKMPLLTLTARKAKPDRLELLYAESDRQERLAWVPLAELRGKWVAVTERIRYGEKGAYEIRLRDLQSKEIILFYRQQAIRLWRDGAEFIQPKWGIYRSLVYANQLRDEAVLFGDFVIQKFPPDGL